MNRALVDQIAAAVLYEGYILYPYRPSVKNQQRWTFGGLYPRAYSEAHGGSDAWSLQTECLVLGGPLTMLTVSVRFLHLVARLVGELARPLAEWTDDGDPPCRIVAALRVGDDLIYTWQEAVERTIDLGDSSLGTLAAEPKPRDFVLESHRDREPLRDPEGAIVGVLVRERRRVEGVVELSAVAVGEGVYRVSVTVRNRTPYPDASSAHRDAAVLHSLASTHVVLGVRDGQFVSMIDPPEPWRELASECRNVGTWPVLVGADGERDTILSAPIILYDYPRIAPESPGDLFDATEIDEILTLRIMTLTDEEKRAMAAVDERARAVLERTTVLGQDQLLGLHGAMRSLQPLGGS
jgi:hydrogenase maturation protease